ncbi:amidophosphoribosyltransferase [Savitreella phatthalungensis]
MCGILGCVVANPEGFACADLSEGLYIAQHRGQDAAGMVTCGPRGRFYQVKGNGMVANVFGGPTVMQGLIGNMGIAHLRYPTAGSSANSEAQPFYVNSPYGISFAHNGNLVNTPELKAYLDQTAHRHVNTDSDSEVLLNIFASFLADTDKVRINEEDLFTALGRMYGMCAGGYACVAMLAGFGILGFRDPHGIRPLVLGSRETRFGKDYMFASESVVLSQLGYTDVRDVLPGECIIVRQRKQPSPETGRFDPVVTPRQVVPAQSYSPDIFEYVYFARPDSIMDGISVYRSRLAMGIKLAGQVVKALGPEYKSLIDVVVPVPDTSRNSALELAQYLGLNYKEGFIKNRYVGRTFIMPGQQVRRQNVRRKLNAQAQEFRGKSVLIVDDSIVRGTTSKEIVQMARDAGAVKVYFASCAPPIRHNHIYGIDLADRADLVAHDRTHDEISRAIGADKVIYQELDDLVHACLEECSNPNVTTFEVGVFSGTYISGVDSDTLDKLEASRHRPGAGKVAKSDSGIEQAAMDDVALYNGHVGGLHDGCKRG